MCEFCSEYSQHVSKETRRNKKSRRQDRKEGKREEGGREREGAGGKGRWEISCASSGPQPSCLVRGQGAWHTQFNDPLRENGAEERFDPKNAAGSSSTVRFVKTWTVFRSISGAFDVLGARSVRRLHPEDSASRGMQEADPCHQGTWPQQAPGAVDSSVTDPRGNQAALVDGIRGFWLQPLRTLVRGTGGKDWTRHERTCLSSIAATITSPSRTRAVCRLVKSSSFGSRTSRGFGAHGCGKHVGRQACQSGQEMHDVIEAASEWESTFDTVANWMGRSVLLVGTECRPADKQDTKGKHKLTHMKNAVPWFELGAQSPNIFWATRTPLFGSDKARTLCNLQPITAKGMKCRGLDEYTLKRRNGRRE